MRTLSIHKVEVLKNDFHFFDSFIQELRVMGKRAKNKLVLEFEGYDNESRELFELIEVRFYAAQMLSRCPEIFYYLSKHQNMDRLFLSLLSVVKIDRRVGGVVHGTIQVPSDLKETILSETEKYAKSLDDEASMYMIYMLFKKGGTG